MRLSNIRNTRQIFFRFFVCIRKSIVQNYEIQIFNSFGFSISKLGTIEFLAPPSNMRKIVSHMWIRSIRQQIKELFHVIYRKIDHW